MASISDYRTMSYASNEIMYEQIRNQIKYELSREFKKEMDYMMQQRIYVHQIMPNTQAQTITTQKPIKDRNKLDNLIAYYYHKRK